MRLDKSSFDYKYLVNYTPVYVVLFRTWTFCMCVLFKETLSSYLILG